MIISLKIQIVISDNDVDTDVDDDLDNDNEVIPEEEEEEVQEDLSWIVGDMQNTELAVTLNAAAQIETSTQLDLLNTDPVDIFLTFFDAEVIGNIVAQTNLYAIQNAKTFKPVTEEEIKSVLGIFVTSSFMQSPRYGMYWDKEPMARNDAICESMSRDRFKHILRFLHFVYNDSLVLGTDRFGKIRPLFDQLNKKFVQNANRDEMELDVDESMIPFFGRHLAKQSLPSKPIRYGFKNFCLNQASGYLLQVDPYQGSYDGGIETKKNLQKEFGVGGATVLMLLKAIKPVVGCLYIDNFFSSPRLFRKLAEMQIGAVATFRRNRVEKCPLDKNMIKKERGTVEVFHQEPKEIEKIM